MYETGAEIRFDCELCSREVIIELGGPGLDDFAHMKCPNSDCDAEWYVKYEVEPLQPSPWES